MTPGLIALLVGLQSALIVGLLATLIRLDDYVETGPHKVAVAATIMLLIGETIDYMTVLARAADAA